MKSGTLRTHLAIKRPIQPHIGARLGPDGRATLYRLFDRILFCVWQPGYRKDREHIYRPDPPIPDGLTGGLKKHETPAFLWMNFCRYRLLMLLPELVADRSLGIHFARELVGWATEAERTRNQIVAANTGLAYRIADRTRRGDRDEEAYRQEAILVMFRAIDRYDAGRGIRFSTYVWPTIYREMGRQQVAVNRRLAVPTSRYDDSRPITPRNRPGNGTGDPSDLRDIRRLLDARAGPLSEYERTVLKRRFGIGRACAEAETLDTIGKALGVSKERVRQVEAGALLKLRGRMLLPSSLLS